MAIILGSSGMLGSMMAKVMPEAETLNRPELDAQRFDKFHYEFEDRVINCVGLIKPQIKNSQEAILVNALFPYRLPPGTIQIATDCVYSGDKGNYVETDPHDALDVYGKTKSLGEAPHLINLRCSIIGPELKNHLSLLDWFLAQEGEVNGFTNHWWNGVTTYHFAKIVKGIIESGMELPFLQHIIPAHPVTKATLLKYLAKYYKHPVTINPVKAPQAVNRTLFTNDSKLNAELWKLAGYDEPPTIKQMIKELARQK